MNTDEANRCLKIAKESFSRGDYEKALKFFKKSYQLENRDSTLQLITECESAMKNKDSNEGNSNSHQQQPHHGRSKSSEETGTAGSSGSSRPNASSSQKSQEIKKIINTKDFYEILGVSKTSTEDEIKKNYKKLALKFHPDKNNEPGADEAFKKIAQAYDCLTNVEKRRKYDEFGNEDPDQHYRHYRQYYSEDISPEDIFGMFFGNAFFQEGPSRRRYVYRTHRTDDGQGENRGRGQQQRNNGSFKYLPLLQFLPLLIIIISSFALNFQTEEPIFSLTRNYKFNIERRTTNLKLPFYVDHSFQGSIGGNRKKLVTLEENIERDFVKNLRNQCNSAKHSVSYLEQRARNNGGAVREELLRQAKNIDLSSCDDLLKIKSKFPHLLGNSYYYY